MIQLNPIKLVGFVAETEVDQVSVGAMAGARLVSGREKTGRVSFPVAGLPIPKPGHSGLR